VHLCLNQSVKVQFCKHGTIENFDAVRLCYDLVDRWVTHQFGQWIYAILVLSLKSTWCFEVPIPLQYQTCPSSMLAYQTNNFQCFTTRFINIRTPYLTTATPIPVLPIDSS